jgi:chromosomal replication initiation ATPase DnaA
MLDPHGVSAAAGRALPRPTLLASIEDDERILEILFSYLDRTRPTVAEIRQAICEYYLVSPAEMASISRMRAITLARWMFAYLAYRYTRCSMPVIAKRIGYADHSSVHYGIRQIEQWLLTRPLLVDDLDLLRLRIAEMVLMRRTGEGNA